jgi:hypothetical protein
MSSRLVTLCDAVVTILQGAYASAGYSIAKYFLPEGAIEDLTTITMVVIPSRDQSDLTRRGTSNFTSTMDVQIGILKKLDTSITDPASSDATKIQEIADLIGLSEAVEALFPAGNPGGIYPARTVLLSQTRLPIYDEKIMREDKTFSAQIVLSFKYD